MELGGSRIQAYPLSYIIRSLNLNFIGSWEKLKQNIFPFIPQVITTIFWYDLSKCGTSNLCMRTSSSIEKWTYNFTFFTHYLLVRFPIICISQ